MNFLQVFGNDMKTLVRSKAFAVSLIAIICIPVLYSLLYLDAFWDPYGTMKDLPVAVVNLDEGTTVDGKSANYGNDLVDNLKDNHSVKWSFVSKKAAYDGLKGEKYYSVFIIQKDFSKNVASAKTGKPLKGGMKFVCNEKKNFLAAQVSTKIQSKLKAKVVSTVTKNYVEGAFNKLYEVKDGMNKAADGSIQLSSGLTTLQDGIDKIDSGSNKLANGASTLYQSYTNTIYPSIQTLASGTLQIQQGIEAKQSDINALSAGANGLLSNSDAIAQGATDIQSNYQLIKAGSEKLISGATDTTSTITKIASKLKEAYAATDDSTKNAKILETLGLIQTYSENNADSAKQISELSTGLNNLSDGMNTYNGKVKLYTEGAKAVSAGTTSLISSVSNAHDGIAKVSNGLSSLQDGLDSQFGPGLQQISTGANSLYDGSSSALQGANKLVDGSKDLSTQVSDGANKLNSGLINSSVDMGDFVSDPVVLKVSPINPVANYGSGFAPYFMNLSLWIGALMMFFVVQTRTGDDEHTSNFSKVFGKFLAFSLVSICQALLVGIAVIGLGLRPTNYPLYFGMLIFCSFVYLAIVQCLVTIFGDLGKLLSIILLILQLTGCAGTFPLELSPKFFSFINPVMPFTYAVQALREICGATVINYSIIGKDLLILGVAGITFFTVSVLLKRFGEKFTGFFEGRREKYLHLYDKNDTFQQ